MAKVTMTLQGFDAVQRAISRAPDLVAALAGNAVQASTFAVAQRARSLVPVSSGDLKAAIEATSTGTSGRVGLVAIGGPLGPMRYWRYVEYGTAHRSARPFFRPAADLESAAFIGRMRAIGPRLERDFSTGRFL
jgi:HK97 gp10 family phage protein